MYEQTPILEHHEVEAILNACNTNCPTGARDYALFQLLAQTGLRITEALNVRLDDIHQETWQVDGHPQDMTVLRVRTETTKGKAPRNGLPLCAATRQAIASWMEHRKRIGVQSPHLFCTVAQGHGCRPSDGPHSEREAVELQPGRQMSASQARSKLKRLARDAGIARRVHPHMFRHTSLTELYDRTHDLQLVKAVAGHASLKTTERYVHVRPTNVALAMGVLDAAAPAPEIDPRVMALGEALLALPQEQRAALAELLVADATAPPTPCTTDREAG